MALAVVVAVAFALGGCDDIRDGARQTFQPHTPGVLTVATDLPAPGFWDEASDGTADGGTTVDGAEVDGGFEYLVAEALAQRFGLRLDVVDVPFAKLIDGELGGADLALAQISITDERAERLGFSTPYYTTSAGVLATTGTTIADLRTAREQRWVVAAGTTEADFVDDVIQPDADTLVVEDDSAAAQAVLDGRADAALLDVSSELVLQDRFPGLATVARFDTDERYGAAVPRGDELNLQLIDAGLRALDADGSLRDFADQTIRAGNDSNDLPVIVTGE